MKIKRFLYFFFLTSFSFSQGIVVDTTSLTIPQLVHGVLMQNSCSNENNFLFSSHKGIGSFTNTNPNFPFKNGIIIRNGIAKYSEGSYTGLNLSSQISSFSDVDLQTISNNSSQTGNITDIGFIQFDFTPLSNSFSFDFLFASNEYGEYQCGFSDVFAFLLTDLTTNDQTNLAVIPGTYTPVTVKNIRDSANNSSCLSNNPTLFSKYNITDPSTSATNLKGETVLLTASSTVIPNRTYRIKLAIGDYYDSNYDSAVFIKGGSFTTTTNLGPDKTICEGEKITLTSGIMPPFLISWTLNGVVLNGERSTTLLATKPGTYGVIGSLPNSGCKITDEITIVDLTVNSLNNLAVCNSGQTNYSFDLTQNNLDTLGLKPTDYSIAYYASLADANDNNPKIPTNELTSYSSTGGQTIYVKISRVLDGNTICENLLPFDLIVNPIFIATTPPDLNICYDLSGVPTTDLTLQNSVILNGQTATDFVISYFIKDEDAQSNTNAISNPTAFEISLTQYTQTIWVRMSAVSSTTCFNIVSFIITVSPKPNVDTIQSAIECKSYKLPEINNGNYFTGANRSGTMLKAGDIITLPGTYYIFIGPDANGCINESSFKIILIDQLSFPLTGCGVYKIPTPPVGNFYTAAGGLGTIIPAGTLLTTSQTIYYYAIINGAVCRDEGFSITVIPLPLADNPSDVLICNSYTLPVLNNGAYFTDVNGGGTQLNAETIISASKTIYIYSMESNGCSNQYPWRIDIQPLPLVDSFTDVFTCSNYTLPALRNGKYYTATNGPHGTGTLLDTGTEITTSQRIYIYNELDTFSGCNNETYFNIQFDLIDVGSFSNISTCDSYELPLLSLGDYYSLPNGAGTIIPVGTVLTSSQRIYVYKNNGTRITCSDQKDFYVTITPTPILTTQPDIFACGNYILPALSTGNYYSQPLGAGTAYLAGKNITASQKMYIYANSSAYSSCFNQVDFNITIYPSKDLIINDGVICVDNANGALVQSYTIDSGLSPTFFTIEWYLNDSLVGTGQKYTALQEGTYTIVVQKKTSLIGDCNYNPTKVVIRKSSTAIATVSVSSAFVDVIDVTTNITGGFGDYEFQIDGGAFQTSNVFYNVNSETHTISINDTKGNCGALNLEAHIIKYPKYFTPNGDGYHEFWNIPDLDFQTESQLYIYDRYGKLLKQIKTNEPGWDGNYNGNPLPSTDYWFQVFYKFNGINQEFKSHFSLKR